jgi:hypothetical protein
MGLVRGHVRKRSARIWTSGAARGAVCGEGELWEDCMPRLGVGSLVGVREVLGSDDDRELVEAVGLCDGGAVRLWDVLLWRRGWLGFV